MSDFTGVRADQLEPVWPFVLPMIEDAAGRSNGRFTAEDVKAALLKESWQLWLAHDGKSPRAICVTELLVYPSLKVCAVVLATGHDRTDWIEHLKVIEAWAAAKGCSRIEAWARPGWRRVLKDYEWTHVLLEKDLCPAANPAP